MWRWFLLGRLWGRFRSFLEVFLLCLGGSIPVAAFFITALFRGYTPLDTAETGTILILTPLVIAILLGFLLSEYDLRWVTAGTLFITVFASAFIVLFIMSPIVAGVASQTPAVTPDQQLEIFVAQRVMLFVVMSFPVLLVGAVVGRALSERLVPSEELRRELEQLRKETKEWHEILERRGKVQKPSETVAAEPDVKQDQDSTRSR